MPDQKQGRQSPEPEQQTGAQQQDAQAKPNDQGVKKSSDDKETLKNLESNPEHILAKHSEETTSKK
jgi:hypothetical protein